MSPDMTALAALTAIVQVENILPLQKFRRFTFSAEMLTYMFPLLANTDAAESSDGYMSLMCALKFFCNNSRLPDKDASSEIVRPPLEAAVR